MSGNPFVALAATLVADLVPGGPLAVLFERTRDVDAYDPTTRAYDPGAPLVWAARGFWSTVGATPAEEVASGGLAQAGRRVVMVTGATLTPDLYAGVWGAPPLVPTSGDTVRLVPNTDALTDAARGNVVAFTAALRAAVDAGDVPSYVVQAVTPVGAPGGGLAPLYRLEAQF